MEKTVCVTGADRGLGFALVKALLASGSTVFAGTYLQQSAELDRLSEEFPGRLHQVVMDVSSLDSVKAAAASITGQTDRLDLLINNAGVLGDITSTVGDELDDEDMLRSFNVNSLGALRAANALIEPIMRGGKLIVTISSEAGSIADCERDAWFGYCMSKAAVNMGMTVFHNKIKKDGGRVMLFHPGWVKSYMSGVYTDEATFTPGEAAGNILRLIAEHRDHIGERPLYLEADTGKIKPW
jgi:NAD(P)-dependent dehydrogenase (short-subunit alcohol dehydrogenase family)